MIILYHILFNLPIEPSLILTRLLLRRATLGSGRFARSDLAIPLCCTIIERVVLGRRVTAIAGLYITHS